jgi:hypothetical protein
MPATRIRVSRLPRYALLALTAGLSIGMSAQQDVQPQMQTIQLQPPAPNGPTGSVSGTVIAQDTQKPVRFANVQLQSVASASASSNRPGGGFGGGGGFAQTDAEGTFLAINVAPGDYYVTATAPGYIPERALLTAQLNAGADVNGLMASLPTVRVSAESMSSVNVTIQRGGTIAGRVLWEDGSPAAGLNMVVVPNAQATNQLPSQIQSLQFSGNNSSTTSDDRGNFRISGLPSGDYIVTTVIQSRTPNGGRGQQAVSSLTVYSPGAFRRSAAKAVSVRSGDERNDVQLTVDLRSLRTVSGHVNSTNSSQNVASGRVVLSDNADGTLHIQGVIDANGNFVVKYVPPGNYTLQISGASTLANGGFRRGGGSSNGGVSFQQFSQAVVVTDADLTGYAATLNPQ